MAELRWQSDQAEAVCPHGRTAVQAEAGDDRASLEAKAVVGHLDVACECWQQLMRRENARAIHALLVARGARCGAHE
jgi:hypothetical protein